MPTQVFTISPDVDLKEAARVMWQEKIGRLLAAAAEQLVAVLTEADLKYILENKITG
jgi:CBS domain-containing protein